VWTNDGAYADVFPFVTPVKFPTFLLQNYFFSKSFKSQLPRYSFVILQNIHTTSIPSLLNPLGLLFFLDILSFPRYLLSVSLLVFRPRVFLLSPPMKETRGGYLGSPPFTNFFFSIIAPPRFVIAPLPSSLPPEFFFLRHGSDRPPP